MSGVFGERREGEDSIGIDQQVNDVLVVALQHILEVGKFESCVHVQRNHSDVFGQKGKQVQTALKSVDLLEPENEGREYFVQLLEPLLEYPASNGSVEESKAAIELFHEESTVVVAETLLHVAVLG